MTGRKSFYSLSGVLIVERRLRAITEFIAMDLTEARKSRSAMAAAHFRRQRAKRFGIESAMTDHIEAVAKALARINNHLTPWEKLPEVMQEQWRMKAKVILAAAQPKVEEMAQKAAFTARTSETLIEVIVSRVMEGGK